MVSISLFTCIPCNWAFEKQPHLLVFGAWLLAVKDHYLSIQCEGIKVFSGIFLFIHLPWACVCGFPPIPLYLWVLLNVSVSWRFLLLLLLWALNVLLYSPSCNLFHQMPASLKTPCGSHVAQQVPLLSVGLQADIQTMPLFPSVLWVWWNRNQSPRKPLSKPSQNVANKFHFFPLLSQGRNWELGGFLQTVPCQEGV